MNCIITFFFFLRNIEPFENPYKCGSLRPLFELPHILLNMLRHSMSLKCLKVFKAFQCNNSTLVIDVSVPIITKISFFFSCGLNELLSNRS
jgi:hypothetical protein